MGAVITSSAADRAMINRKDYRMALIKREHLGARLAARLLLGEHKLAPFKIPAGLAQKHRNLKGEENITVQILMQTIEITGPVLEQQRGRPLLAGAVTF